MNPQLLAALEVYESTATKPATQQDTHFVPANHFDEVQKTTFINVSVEGCDFSDFRLKGCTWKNVRFINCKARHVLFSNVRLTDVHFENTGFNNVSFRDMRQKLSVWQNISIRDTMLSAGSVKAPWAPGVGFQSSISYPPEVLLSDPGERLHRILAPDEAARTKTFPTLENLPGDALQLIVRELYDIDPIYIYDHAEYDARIKACQQAGQTTYMTKTEGDRWSGRHTYTTTYFGSRQTVCEETVSDKSPLLPRKLEFDTSFLRASSKLYRAASKYVYDREFRFQCSAEGAAAFLKDHRSFLCQPMKVGLWYHLRSRSGPLATHDASWRKLLAFIRHKRYSIEHLTLHLGEEFWKAAYWEQGADIVFNQTDINRASRLGTLSEKGEKNFLGE